MELCFFFIPEKCVRHPDLKNIFLDEILGKVEMMKKTSGRSVAAFSSKCLNIKFMTVLTLLLSVRVKYLIFPLRLLKANLGWGCCYCYEVMGIIWWWISYRRDRGDLSEIHGSSSPEKGYYVIQCIKRIISLLYMGSSYPRLNDLK